MIYVFPLMRALTIINSLEILRLGNFLYYQILICSIINTNDLKHRKTICSIRIKWFILNKKILYLSTMSPLVHRTNMILQEIGCTLESYTEEKLYKCMIKKVNEELTGLSSCWMVDRNVFRDTWKPPSVPYAKGEMWKLSWMKCTLHLNATFESW